MKMSFFYGIKVADFILHNLRQMIPFMHYFLHNRSLVTRTFIHNSGDVKNNMCFTSRFYTRCSMDLLRAWMVILSKSNHHGFSAKSMFYKCILFLDTLIDFWIRELGCHYHTNSRRQVCTSKFKLLVRLRFLLIG